MPTSHHPTDQVCTTSGNTTSSKAVLLVSVGYSCTGVLQDNPSAASVMRLRHYATTGLQKCTTSQPAMMVDLHSAQLPSLLNHEDLPACSACAPTGMVRMPKSCRKQAAAQQVSGTYVWPPQIDQHPPGYINRPLSHCHRQTTAECFGTRCLLWCKQCPEQCDTLTL